MNAATFSRTKIILIVCLSLSLSLLIGFMFMIEGASCNPQTMECDQGIDAEEYGLLLESLTPSPTAIPSATPTPTPTTIPTVTPIPLPTIEPTLVIPTTAAQPTQQVVRCQVPGEVLNLKTWKVTLPVKSTTDPNEPLEIRPPLIQDYAMDPWFVVQNNCQGVRFRAHTSAEVTTTNSSYPRTELRELTNGRESAWSNDSGVHTLYVDQAITSVPHGKRQVVSAQIHDGSSDVTTIRLDGTTLYATEDNNVRATVIDGNYQLGQRFQVKLVASQNKIETLYKKNGGTFESKQVINKTIKNSYFKTGVYTQSNCEKEKEYGSQCSANNYGEVVIYDVWVRHE